MAAIGIDFGTTTSVAAIAGDNDATLVEVAGESIIPSVVAFLPGGGHVVGKDAKYRRPIDAENAIFSVKRIIGQRQHHSSVKRFAEDYPFVLEADVDGYPLFRTRAGAFSATQIAAKIIEPIAAAAAGDGDDPTTAVIGVPCDFAAHQRRATLHAAELAGLPNAVCVDEPLAIARAYLQGDLQRVRRIAVYDLGGGTFDLAICEIRGGVGSLVAAGGHPYLGGDDIDRVCADWVVDEVRQRWRWDIHTSSAATTRLLAQCERAKIALSTMSRTRIKLGAVGRDDLLAGHELPIERTQLEDWIVGVVRRTFVVCDEVLARARLQARDMDEVFLAGGSTRIPAVRKAVEHYFRGRPRTSATPDQLVAMGAASIARELGRDGAKRNTPIAAERRRQRRVGTSLGVQVQLAGLDEFQQLWARDISRGGLFVAMPDPPELHREVLVRILVGEETTIDLTGEVVHRVVSPRGPSLTGMGIELRELDASQQTEMEGLVARAKQLFGPGRPDLGSVLRVDEGE